MHLPLSFILAAGIVLTLLAMLILLPYQDIGWGYRYVHGVIGSAALILSCLAVAFAYALERKAGTWRRALEALIEIPYALPGVVLAIACILLFLRPLPLLGVSLYATPFIIVFAYLARFLPLALKPPLAPRQPLTPKQPPTNGQPIWQKPLRQRTSTSSKRRRRRSLRSPPRR